MIKMMVKIAVISALAMLVYFIVVAATGRSCLACEYDPTMQVDFFNPSAEDVGMLTFMLALVCAFPFASMGVIALVLLGIRVTASAETLAAAEEARAMGEEGVGTELFLGKSDKFSSKKEQ